MYRLSDMAEKKCINVLCEKYLEKFSAKFSATLIHPLSILLIPQGRVEDQARVPVRDGVQYRSPSYRRATVPQRQTTIHAYMKFRVSI